MRELKNTAEMQLDITFLADVRLNCRSARIMCRKMCN